MTDISEDHHRAMDICRLLVTDGTCPDSSCKSRDQLVDQLVRDLPEVENEDIAQIASVICGKKISFSINNLAFRLIQSGIHVGDLLAALLRSEWLILNRMMRYRDSSSIDLQVKHYAESVSHFNQLQDSILRAADRQSDGPIDAARKELILSQCRVAWSNAGMVRLYNFFKEVPVEAKVTFIDFEGDSLLLIKACPSLRTVFSASLNGHDAFIASPDNKYSLIVSGSSVRDGIVSLLIKGVFEASRERRSEVRVAVDDLPVRMTHRGDGVSGMVSNISYSGMGVMMDAPLTINPNEMLDFSLSLDRYDLAIRDAEVRWVQENRVGLKFDSGSHREKISRYLFGRQQQVANQVRQLGTPKWLTVE